jgi:multidrug resistance efflux pump
VGSLTGGVIEQLAVEVGQTVEAKQLIGRVMLQGEPELLTAPWRGTVTSVSERLGDTVVPGTVIFTIADLSRYQVETSDIDEYLIGYIYPTQAVIMRIEAVEQTQISGVVRTVGLQQQQSSSGANYPVTIDFAQQDPSLRPGMTVRITFAEHQS